jgi:hypothetical protein
MCISRFFFDQVFQYEDYLIKKLMSLQSVFQYKFNDVNYGLYSGDIVSQFFQSELATKCMYELSLGNSNKHERNSYRFASSIS